MTIKYKDRAYDAVDNGDGSFTLSPTAPQVNVSVDQLREAYRVLRGKASTLVDQRAQINARLTELAARRDELKALIQASGADPDAVEAPE